MTYTPKQHDPAVEELERKLSADGELATSPCRTTFRPIQSAGGSLFFVPRQKVQFSVVPQFGQPEILQRFQKATPDQFKDCGSNMAMLLKHLLSFCCCAPRKAELLSPAVTRIN